MLSCLLRGRSMSQRLSLLLLLFGLAWCLLLLHYTITQPRHQSSAELRQQILDLSQRYVKALRTENHELSRSYNPSMAGYADLKRTIAVLLDDILNRLVKLESRLDATVNSSMHSPAHVTETVMHRPIKQNESGTNSHINQPEPLTRSGR